ncbi:MAG: hypothetical protein JSS02_10550 [Planctomycetes bacterium]|nr:hypothetical protein [Planctomycetota bacterium]
MSELSKPAPEPLVVECRTCHERMAVTLVETAQSVECSFCQATIEVPSLKNVLAARAAKQRRALEPVDTYEIAAPDQDRLNEHVPKKPVSERAAKKSSRSQTPAPEALAVTLECTICHELNPATLGPQPARIACNFCQSIIHVPDRRTYERHQRKPIETAPPTAIGEYTPGPIPETKPLRLGNLFDRLGEVRQEVIPPPPRWTFLSGIVSFLFRPETGVRWGYMSLGFVAIFGISYFLGVVAGAGVAVGVALAFFVLPIIWISIFTFSYTVACSLFVFESTAAGMDQIESWPESNWREWMVELMYVGWIGVIPLTIAFGSSQIAGKLGYEWYSLTPLLFFLIFPISFLSALEANTIWVPLTRPVLGSLFRWWWCWLSFYVLAALLLGSVGFLQLYLLNRFQLGLLILTSPIVPATSLIYFRLLGRLAWRITNDLKKPRKVSPPVAN